MKIKIFLFIFTTVLGMITPSSCKKDKKNNTPPVITITGKNPYTVDKNSNYADPGATAYDETDGDITTKITATSNVNTADTGTYHVNYNVTDNAGNAATEAVRTVKVIIM